MQRIPKEFMKQTTQNDQPTTLFGHLVVLIDCVSSLTSDSVQRCISQMQCDFKELPVIGFDVEWKPVFKKGVKPRLALLQIASRRACLLVKLHPDCREADIPVLEALFGSGGLFSQSDLIACGVGVCDDIKMLKQQLSIVGIDAFARICDVAELAVEWGVSMKRSLKDAFLAALCKPMNKSKKVTMSNWETELLSTAQVQYASGDAIAGLAIMASIFQNRMLLANHKGWPTPPLLTLSATDLHAMHAASNEIWNFANIMKVGIQQGSKDGNIEALLSALQITGGYLFAKKGGLVNAVKYGHFECLRAILSLDIMDVSACTKDGLAVQTAVKHNQLDCLQVLVGARVDVNTRVQNASNISALQLAVKMGRIECIQVLLAAGAEVNAVSEGGVTALYLCKSPKTSYMLFTAGANILSCESAHRDALIQEEHRAFMGIKQQYFQKNRYYGGISKQSSSLLNTKSKLSLNHNEVFSEIKRHNQISPRTQKMFGSITLRTIETFEAIVANVPDINCCNIGKKGDTALMTILRNNKIKKKLRGGDEIEISKIQILLKYGASWVTKNKLGETAEDLLKSYDSNLIARIKAGLLEGARSSSVDLSASIESKVVFKSDFPFSPIPSDDITSLSSTVMFSSKAKKICNISVMEKANIDGLTIFLNHISFGKQDQAEDMLCQNHDLVLMSGNLIDCANRQFTQITAFQYAAWALDWGMLEMLKKYLPKEAMHKQIAESERGAWIQKYGSVVSWQKLINALQGYIDNYNIWTDLECRVHWIKNVGSEQLMLPAHIIQEYCRSDKTQKSAEPVLLSRIDITINKNWFENNKGEKLGKDFGRIRGYIGKKDGKCRSIPVKDIRFNEHWINMIKHDIKLLERLLKVRLQQCTNFIFNPSVVETSRNTLNTQKFKCGLEPYLEQINGNTSQRTSLKCSSGNNGEYLPILPFDEQSLTTEFTTKCRLTF